MPNVYFRFPNKIFIILSVVSPYNNGHPYIGIYFTVQILKTIKFNKASPINKPFCIYIYVYSLVCLYLQYNNHRGRLKYCGGHRNSDLGIWRIYFVGYGELRSGHKYSIMIYIFNYR